MGQNYVTISSVSLTCKKKINVDELCLLLQCSPKQDFFTSESRKVSQTKVQ